MVSKILTISNPCSIYEFIALSLEYLLTSFLRYKLHNIVLLCNYLVIAGGIQH